MQSDLPTITVVTPSYNQGQFLAETIESVLNQNYPRLEYFVVDGNSTDDSVGIIRKYERSLSWWTSEPDEGQTDALCKGFDRATGQLLVWLNSDDIFFPDALLRVGNAWAQSPHACLYVGGIAVGEKDDGAIRMCSLPTRPLPFFSRFGFRGFGQQGTFFSSEVYLAVGGLDRSFYMRMDSDIFHRLLAQNQRTVIINEVLGFFRWHEASKCTVSEDRYRREHETFVETLDINPTQLTFRRFLFKLYRLVSGGYYRSWQATRNYRGFTMKTIWEKHIEQRKGAYL